MDTETERKQRDGQRAKPFVVIEIYFTLTVKQINPGNNSYMSNTCFTGKTGSKTVRGNMYNKKTMMQHSAFYVNPFRKKMREREGEGDKQRQRERERRQIQSTERDREKREKSIGRQQNLLYFINDIASCYPLRNMLH